MAINFSNPDYLNSLNKTATGGYTSYSGSDLSAGMFNTSNLKSGQTLSGEVISADDKNITLKLTNGQTLNARLDSGASVAVGKMLSFEVNTSNNTISLRPLYANLNNNSTIVSALRAAGLPITEANGEMTKAMMQEGMNINRNSLLDMARNVYSMPGADPASIVKMTKLGLPIDELNVTQFENYKNFEHRIINDVGTVSDGIGSLISEALSNGNSDSLQNISELMNLFDASLIEDSVTQNSESVTGALQQENASAEMEIATAEIESEIINQDNAENAVTQSSAQNALSSIRDAIASRVNDLVTALNPGSTESQALAANEQTVPENDLNGKLSELADYLKVSYDENLTDSQKFLFIRDAITLLNESASSNGINETLLNKVKDIFNQSDTGKLLGNALKSQLTLTPEKVSQKEAVDDLYNRILKISQKIMDISTQNPESISDIAKSAQNLQNNVNFMNNINQFVNYIQLPLKMSGEDAHGELYVYSNKKNLQENPGNLTALLHLDMEHLGPMDVYVAMENYTNVSTNFRLADEKILDFIAANIDQLTKRLIEKGYNVNSTFSVTDNFVGSTSPVTDEFMKDNPVTQQREIAMVQFDVRA